MVCMIDYFPELGHIGSYIFDRWSLLRITDRQLPIAASKLPNTISHSAAARAAEATGNPSLNLLGISEQFLWGRTSGQEWWCVKRCCWNALCPGITCHIDGVQWELIDIPWVRLCQNGGTSYPLWWWLQHSLWSHGFLARTWLPTSRQSVGYPRNGMNHKYKSWGPSATANQSVWPKNHH